MQSRLDTVAACYSKKRDWQEANKTTVCLEVINAILSIEAEDRVFGKIAMGGVLYGWLGKS